MNITLSLGDFLMIAAVVLLVSRGSWAYFAGPSRRDLRMQRQLDAIMKHLGLQEPVVSAPGALSIPVQALLDAGRRIEAIKLYRQETGAELKEAKQAIDRGAGGAAAGR